MKAAIIYYSYEGSCARIADLLKPQLGADVYRLETEDGKKRKGLTKYLWGGRQVFMHKKPALKPYSIDLKAYELLVFGFPVWAASPAPPIQTFLSEAAFTGKKTALFCCHLGGRGRAVEKFKALLPRGNTVAGEIDFVNTLKQDRQKLSEQLSGWVRDLGR